jgi:two-component system response regulator LytT
MSDVIYSVLIAEDELPAREKLVEYVLTVPELKLGGIAKDGDEALRAITGNHFDLVFLDIHLPQLSGIEVLERARDIPYVIFTTAFDQYAVKAFDCGAIDYILKPFSLERFQQAVGRFLTIKKDSTRTATPLPDIGLSFRESGKHYFMSYRDILYLSSHGKHTVIHTEGRDFETPSLLKDLEAKLPGKEFARIHKGFIVNIYHIVSLEYKIAGHYQVILKDSDESVLTVSRTYAQSLKDKMNVT